MRVRYLNKNYYIYTLESNQNQFAKGNNICLKCFIKSETLLKDHDVDDLNGWNSTSE